MRFLKIGGFPLSSVSTDPKDTTCSKTLGWGGGGGNRPVKQLPPTHDSAPEQLRAHAWKERKVPSPVATFVGLLRVSGGFFLPEIRWLRVVPTKDCK